MAGLIFLFTNPATMPVRFGMGSAKREARANGFGLYPEASDPMEVEVIDPDNPYVVIASLEKSMNRSFQDVPSGIGSGTVEIMNNDPQLALVNEELALRFRIKGRAATQILVEELSRRTRSEGEESEQSTVISGRSIAAILEESVAYPSRGPATLPIEDSRIFNAANEDFDDSGWIGSHHVAFQNQNTYYWTGLPARWPAPNAAWMWAPGSTSDNARVGVCHFRKRFNVPNGVTKIDIGFSADNAGALWFDGQEIITTDTFFEYQRVVVPVTPGEHLLYVRAENYPGGGYITLPGDPGNLYHTVVSGNTLWAISAQYYGDPTRWPTIYNANKDMIDAAAASAGLPYTGRWAGHWIFPGQMLLIPGAGTYTPGVTIGTNPAGALVSVHESTDNGLGALLAVSNNSWRCLPYPVNEPGMTPGEVLDILLTEAKNRGCFPSLQWTFNRSVDSAGRPWKRVGDISVRVGDDLATVLSQLTETYIDFSMRPAGLVLDVYDIDTPQGGSVTSYTEEYDITNLTNTRSA
jgi:hypothetical protein